MELTGPSYAGPRYYWQGPNKRWYVGAGWHPAHSEVWGRNDVPDGAAIKVVHSPGHYLAVLNENGDWDYHDGTS